MASLMIAVFTLHCRLYLHYLLLFIVTNGISLSHHHGSCHAFAPQSVVPQHASELYLGPPLGSPPPDNPDQEMQTLPILMIASAKAILPGDTTTISLKDQESLGVIQNCLEHESGIKAAGVVLADTDTGTDADDTIDDDDWTLAQICSLCEVKRFRFTVKNNEVDFRMDVQSIGRVRVHHLREQYSSECFRVESEIVEESLTIKGEREKAELIQQNIALLLQKISKMEQKITRVKEKDDEEKLQQPTMTVQDVFEENLQKVAKAITNPRLQKKDDVNEGSNSREDMIQTLMATSWAVFLSLNDPILEERYRLRALDWDNLLERLRLAQYALREKELLLQGQLISMTGNDASSYPAINNKNNKDEIQGFQ
mgnify:CR=1 FL=1